MNSSKQRLYPRHETEIAVTIHLSKEAIPATMIDLSEGGIGIISNRGLFPGTKVNISLKYIDDYAIHGTVKWANLVTQNGNSHYRIGIEADTILIESEGDATETPERSDFVKRLLSDPGK